MNEANKNVLRTREILHERFGGKCWFESCEESEMEKLQFAHIFKTTRHGQGRGRKERIYDVSKNPGSYAYVCKYHHGLLDDVRDAVENGRDILGLPPIFYKDVDE
jgi:hypothetical protein